MVSQDFAVEQVMEFARRGLREVLQLRDCTFEPVPSGLPYARIIANGTVVHVGLQWPTKELGIPGPQAEVLAQWRGETLGRFVLTPTPGQPVSIDRRVVAVSLATLAAGALARDVYKRQRGDGAGAFSRFIAVASGVSAANGNTLVSIS